MVAKTYAKAGQPRIYQSPEAMQEDIDAYFEECDLLEKPPTISGLVLSMDFANPCSLWDYGGYSKEFSVIITRARLKVMEFVETACHGKQSQGPQFILNAGFGWATNSQTHETREIEISLGAEERELLQSMGSKLIESRIVASVPGVEPSRALEAPIVPVEPNL